MRPRANCVATADGNIQIIGAGGVRNAVVPAPVHDPGARGFDAYGGHDLDGFLPAGAAQAPRDARDPHDALRAHRGTKRSLSDLETALYDHGGEEEDHDYRPGAENGFKDEPLDVDVDLMRVGDSVFSCVYKHSFGCYTIIMLSYCGYIMELNASCIILFMCVFNPLWKVLGASMSLEACLCDVNARLINKLSFCCVWFV